MTIAAVSSEVPVAATGGATVARNGGIDALRACLTFVIIGLLLHVPVVRRGV